MIFVIDFYQIAEPSCVEQTTGVVSPTFCANIARPEPQSRICNEQPCPAKYVGRNPILAERLPFFSKRGSLSLVPLKHGLLLFTIDGALANGASAVLATARTDSVIVKSNV